MAGSGLSKRSLHEKMTASIRAASGCLGHWISVSWLQLVTRASLSPRLRSTSRVARMVSAGHRMEW